MASATEDFAELETALGQVREIALAQATAMIGRCLEAIQQEIEPYPPQPDRMRSGHLNTYVRGVGHYPASAFREGVLKKRIAKSSRAQIKRTSQQMNTRFHINVQASANSVEGTLTNTASYSGHVLGPRDLEADPHQASYHHDTGWVSQDEALERTQAYQDEQMDALADEIIQQLVKA